VKDGIYTNLPYSEYAEEDAVNRSYLVEFAKSPLHAEHYRKSGGKDETDSMRFGTCVHIAILEPARFDEEILRVPKVDRRYKEGKAAWAEFQARAAGRIVLEADDYERVRSIAHAITSHPTARKLYEARGANEVSVFWTDAKTGVRCKCRIDRITELNGYPVVMDLKTTRDVLPRKFQGSMMDFGYDLQAGLGLMGLDALRPIPHGSSAQRIFLDLAVESDAPFDIGVFQVNEEAVLHAQQRIARMLAQYARCRESNTWPGKVGDGIEILDLPEWAYKREPLAQIGEAA